MFYLKEFCKCLGESPLKGLTFFLFSCFLAASLTHRPWLGVTLKNLTPEKMVNPYLVAVLDESVDILRLKQYLEKLPGVMSIEHQGNEKSRSKLKSLINQLGSDYQVDSSYFNFQSMKIVFNPSLSNESLNFVRGQVLKHGGEDHISTTSIKYPEVTSSMKAHPFFVFVEKVGEWGIVGLLVFLWGISYFLCYNTFRSRAYLIERFQRKHMVASKVMASGLGIIVIFFTALGIWNETLKLLDSIFLISIFSIFWTFMTQEWRWKPSV